MLLVSTSLVSKHQEFQLKQSCISVSQRAYVPQRDPQVSDGDCRCDSHKLRRDVHHSLLADDDSTRTGLWIRDIFRTTVGLAIFV